MTEAEWRTTKLPLYMLGRESPAVWDGRKARLFWCACLRRAWQLIDEGHTRRLVEAVEDRAEFGTDWFARKLPSTFERYDRANRGLGKFRDYWALRGFFATPPESLMTFVDFLGLFLAQSTARDTGLDPSCTGWVARRDKGEAAEKAWQCDLIRELFGNPFRPVDVSPWLTSDVIALARGIYAEKAFDRMPILADALQDAGCDNVNVLDHCRESREHVRGCWVVDLLLGKG